MNNILQIKTNINRLSLDKQVMRSDTPTFYGNVISRVQRGAKMQIDIKYHIDDGRKLNV